MGREKVDNVKECLESGVLMIEVLELVAGQKAPKYNKNARMAVQVSDNWQCLVKFMRNLGIPVDDSKGAAEEESVGCGALPEHAPIPAARLMRSAGSTPRRCMKWTDASCSNSSRRSCSLRTPGARRCAPKRQSHMSIFPSSSPSPSPHGSGMLPSESGVGESSRGRQSPLPSLSWPPSTGSAGLTVAPSPAASAAAAVRPSGSTKSAASVEYAALSASASLPEPGAGEGQAWAAAMAAPIAAVATAVVGPQPPQAATANVAI